eukprot:2492630-Pyramimonas_sp.AAC.1
MGSEDRTASPMRLDAEPDFLHADGADASPTSPMRRDPPTPSARTPSRMPLVSACPTGPTSLPSL